MSEFSFVCPHCQASLTADESESGETIGCPGCSSEIRIPGEQVEASDPTSNSQASLRPDAIPVTSGDIARPYDVIGVVCFTVGTRGEMAAEFERHKQNLQFRLDRLRKQGQVSASRGVGQFIGGVGVDGDGNVGVAGQFAGASFRSDDTEIALQIAVNQLQLRASYLRANAIVGFRYDIDFDSHANLLNFMATAYGTAVRLRDS